MADFVLDTHACLFALGAPRKLGRGAQRALRQVEAGRSTAWIPAAVVAEIVLIHELGRTSIGLPQLRAAVEAMPRLRFLPLDLAQLDEFAAHRGIKDPFDRLILSAARATGAKLVTRDGVLQESGLAAVVWD